MKNQKENVISSQTSNFLVYEIEARMNPASKPREFIKIDGQIITETWKRLEVKQDLKEVLGEMSYFSRFDAIQAALCWHLSGEMAGLIVHQLQIKHHSLEFRIIPIQAVFDWKLTSKLPPVKLDLTFKEIKLETKD